MITSDVFSLTLFILSVMYFEFLGFHDCCTFELKLFFRESNNRAYFLFNKANFLGSLQLNWLNECIYITFYLRWTNFPSYKHSKLSDASKSQKLKFLKVLEILKTGQKLTPFLTWRVPFGNPRSILNRKSQKSTFSSWLQNPH